VRVQNLETAPLFPFVDYLIGIELFEQGGAIEIVVGAGGIF
jgi:hypothetical protein